MPILEVHAIVSDQRLVPSWHRDVKDTRTVRPGRSIWHLHGPVGPLQWRVETTMDRPGETVSWAMRSADMAGFLRIDLRSEDRERTALRLSRFLGFRGGPLADATRAWWGDSQQRVEADLAALVAHLRSMVSTPPPPVLADHHLDGLMFPDARPARS